MDEPARSVSLSPPPRRVSLHVRPEGCPNPSFLVDNIGDLSHLHAPATSLVLVSRAPLTKIEALRDGSPRTFCLVPVITIW
jgi:predicted dithiol-disulfide oxidoreductase (DUF899 family)